MPTHTSVLFLGKHNDQHCQRALSFVRANFQRVTAAVGKWGDPLPAEAAAWEGDYIISYLSRWIVPENLLKRARRASINFHPATPEYPGVGCTNFAIYEDSPTYGATCHHMKPIVDTGAVIAVSRFPMLDSDTVHSVHQRCYDYMLALFYDIVTGIVQGKQLPASSEHWTRKPFTRKQLLELERISPDMPPAEIKKRVRAMYYPGMPKPYTELGGVRFELVDIPA